MRDSNLVRPWQQRLPAQRRVDADPVWTGPSLTIGVMEGSSFINLDGGIRSPAELLSRAATKGPQSKPNRSSRSSDATKRIVQIEKPGQGHHSLLLISKCANYLSMKESGAVFKALADPTRREILRELRGGELSAGEIVDCFQMTAPSVSRHLSILSNAGLITSRRAGNQRFYKLEALTLAHTLSDFLSLVCPTQVVQRASRKQNHKTDEDSSSRPEEEA